jgi:DNA-binding transcriptional regulator GbsR (MarR family)
MKIMNNSNMLLQLKIDYIKTMEKVWKSLGYDVTLTGVLFSLLMEKEYVTQEQIIEYTGFSSGTVSERLQELTEITSKFPILETHKPGDKRKYYKNQFSFEQYIISLFTATLKASIDFIEKIPSLLHRLEQLKTSDDIQHVYTRINFFLKVSQLFTAFSTSAERQLKGYFASSLEINELYKELREKEQNYSAIEFEKRGVPNNDSLNEIKHDFINVIGNSMSLVGKRTESSEIFLSLYLSREPLSQDDICTFTGYSRSTVSETLSEILKFNKITNTEFIKVVKKPDDRKKYYALGIKLESMNLSKVRNQTHIFSYAIKVLEERYLNEITEIPTDKDEKNHFKEFIEENIRAYQNIISYITAIFSYLDNRLKEIQSDT